MSALGVEENGKLRVGGEELPRSRPAVVGEIEAPAALEREVDQAAEGDGRLLDSTTRVLDVQVQDDARPRLTRPRENALVVALDQADGAVDDVRLECAQVARGRRAGSPRAAGAGRTAR